MENKKGDKKLILKLSKLMDFIKFNGEWKKDILKWILFTLFINIIIMYLNPISITNSAIKDSVPLSIIEKIFKLILNSVIFMSIGMFLLPFKFRSILISIYSIVWIGLGLANNILMEVRNSPLTKYDFTMISEGLKLGESFLNNSHYLKIATFILFSILLLIVGIIEQKKSKKYKLKTIIFSWICLLLLNNGMLLLSSLSNDEHIDNYSKFGFVYAFAENVSTADIKKPKNYKESTIKNIKSEIDKEYEHTADGEQPNILAIQLESFFDIKTINNLTLSENPTPYFDKLCENYTSGLIKVPTIGGGTARSEFEFVTGLSMKYMKDGLIPHNSILKRTPYISSAYALKNSGYTTHLLHNFAGYFYNRDIVYNNLGFDTFTSLEFLNNASENPSVIKASRDNIFPNELKKILMSTDSKDFIFGITTQLHGNYEEDYSEFENNIIVSGKDFTKPQISQFNDYANELKSIDNIIKDIIETVEDLDEPTIIIFYSDHLPPLSYKNTNIKGNSRYLVPYVVWDNIGLEKEDVDLNVYELLSKYMNLAGIEGNYINKLQSISIDEKKKEEYQELIQYDITVGKNYIGETLLPYKVNTKLGLNDIVIDSVQKEDITYTINGQGFTPSMVLVIDGSECGILCEDESTVKFTTNLNLEGKDIYFKIRIGQNENSVVKSNVFKVR